MTQQVEKDDTVSALCERSCEISIQIGVEQQPVHIHEYPIAFTVNFVRESMTTMLEVPRAAARSLSDLGTTIRIRHVAPPWSSPHFFLLRGNGVGYGVDLIADGAK
jgi:hypothetical protein